MAFIVGIAAAIWGAVTAAVSAIVSVISTVITTIAAVICDIGFALEVGLSYIVGVELAGVIASALPAIWNIVSIAYSAYSIVQAFSAGDVAGGVAGVVGSIGMVYSIAGGTLGGFVEDLVTGFKKFTESINLELALKINDIAYLVSEEYRSTMNNVYVQVGKVSRSLGNSAEFMTLLLRDAKYMIQDTAALMGRKYDLGELVWVQQLENFFKMVNERAGEYEHNPGEMIQDLDQLLFKPALDVKAGVFQNLYAMVEGVLVTSEQVIEATTTLRGEFDEFYDKIPAQLRGEIKATADKILGKYDYWIDNIYKPTHTTIKIAIDKYHDDILSLGRELYELALFVKNPADYLAKINSLNEDDRLRAYSIIEAVLTGRYDEYLRGWDDTLKPQTEHLNRMRLLLERKIEYPSWHVDEIVTPQRAADTPVEPRKTWDVGDY